VSCPDRVVSKDGVVSLGRLRNPPGVRSIKACWTRKDARNALRGHTHLRRRGTDHRPQSGGRHPAGLSMIVHGHLWTHLDVSVPSMLAHLGIAV
jgi:hypothetical protein